ncbi:MAG: ribosome recycling factor [Patescibacteria group bacterium]
MYAGQVELFIAHCLIFVNMNLDEAKQKMQKVLEVLRTDLATIRTGRATPSLVEHLIVNVYGGTQRLRIMELATIVTTDAQTLLITPFDASIITEIQKGIMASNVGLTPVVDGQAIRISIPPLSEERREELIKLMRQKLENGRIQIRQVRHEAMTAIKKQFTNKEISKDELTRVEKEIQKATDDIMAAIETMRERKEKELLQI